MLNEFTTIFIIILNSNNKPVWIIIYSMFYLQYLFILDLEVLGFWLFIELDIWSGF